MSNTLLDPDAPSLAHWIAMLESIVDGETAVERLVAAGEPAIPYLRQVLQGRPRTVALPRCRVAHALGMLGARRELLAYLHDYCKPEDAQVLFAEDAVRSVTAHELLRWKTDEVFHELLRAVKIRATQGLVFAIGEFRRKESVPSLFYCLADDFCREEAKAALGKVQASAYAFATLLIRRLTDLPFYETASRGMRRATLQLLREWGVPQTEWPEICPFLWDTDPDAVIAAAQIGSDLKVRSDWYVIVKALFRISEHANWVQEADILELLEARRADSEGVAETILRQWRARGDTPDWIKPSWRIMRSILPQRCCDEAIRYRPHGIARFLANLHHSGRSERGNAKST